MGSSLWALLRARSRTRLIYLCLCGALSCRPYDVRRTIRGAYVWGTEGAVLAVPTTPGRAGSGVIISPVGAGDSREVSSAPDDNARGRSSRLPADVR